MKQVQKIKFSDLPQNIRDHIEPIVNHRKEMRNGVIFHSTILGMTGGLAKELHSLEKSTLGVTVPALITFGLVSLKGLHNHQNAFDQEERGLFHALRDARDPKVRELLSAFPYVIINRNGDLVGKRLNPRIGFIPIGRRRIPTRERPKHLTRSIRPR